MKKPTQAEVDICRMVLEYAIADTTKNEPYAVKTLATLDEALLALPEATEFGDI